MESLALNLRDMRRTPLHPEHLEMIRSRGTRKTYAAGSLVLEAGNSIDHFVLCEEGEIELLNLRTGSRAVESTIGPGQYLGEVSFLNGGRWTISMRAVVDTEVIEVPRQEMLALIAQVPEMSDIIVTVFAARRRATLEEQRSSLTLIGPERDADLRRVESFASRNRIAIESFELNSAQADEAFEAAGVTEKKPMLIFGRDTVVDRPTPRGLARFLGLDLPLNDADAFDVVIVGGGPAGIAAAVYAGAEGLSALVVEDQVIGGQAGSSSRIENYMGFPTGISGADLCFRGELQAMRLGATFTMPRRVAALKPNTDGYCVSLDDGVDVQAKSVVIATGVQYRRLPLEGLEALEGQGVYYAATDLEARYCQNSEAVVIGGGNSAGQAAMYLSRSASHVHALVRGKELAQSMSAYLSSRLEQDPRITIHYQSECVALHGADQLTGITIRNKSDGSEAEITTPALFIMVGAAPRTRWLDDLVELDEKGFVITGQSTHCSSAYATSAPGIYAVGDVRAGSVKRVASSVGEGSVVISHVWNYVNGGSAP